MGFRKGQIQIQQQREKLFEVPQHFLTIMERDRTMIASIEQGGSENA
jgi:hypothetical protein